MLEAIIVAQVVQGLLSLWLCLRPANEKVVTVEKVVEVPTASTPHYPPATAPTVVAHLPLASHESINLPAPPLELVECE